MASKESDISSIFIYISAVIVLGILALAMYKEASFFARDEHGFGPGNFAAAVNTTPVENLRSFPFKLIYWRISFIVAFFISLFSIVVYCTWCDLNKTSFARILGLFVMMVAGSFAMIYYKENFYSFHLYRHFANRFERELE